LRYRLIFVDDVETGERSAQAMAKKRCNPAKALAAQLAK
jgi:hypothetical protein